jgi:hypothetical protein
MNKSFIETGPELKKSQINAKIVNHEIIRDSSLLGVKYVLYTINIQTFYNTWAIKKRYSTFVDLHKVLSTKIRNLPELPPKRLFSMSDETIKERKASLEGYLNYLFKNVNICLYTEILEFIEMEKDLLSLLMKGNTMIENTTAIAVKRNYSLKANIKSEIKKPKSVDTINNDNYYSTFLDYKMEKTSSQKSANMLVIEEFLRNLEFKSENKYDIIKTFESFLKSKKSWPSFKKDEIQKLFYGDIQNNTCGSVSSDNSSLSNNRQVKGLMFHIGNIEQNSLGAERCLEFMGKLLDYEFNPECESYIFIMKTTKPDYLIMMRLGEHMRNPKANIVSICNRILKSALEGDKFMNNKLKKILNDEDLIERFIIWLENDIGNL